MRGDTERRARTTPARPSLRAQIGMSAALEVVLGMGTGSAAAITARRLAQAARDRAGTVCVER
jgi:hypothetical protein